MSRPDDQTLPCGHDLYELVAQIADGTPPTDPGHQESCPHCQNALASLQATMGKLRARASEPVEVPRGLRARVLSRVRVERGVVVIAEGPGGRDTASEAIVASIVRQAARTVEHVEQVSVAIEVHQGATVDLRLHLTARFGPSLPALAGAVRSQVVAHVETLIGVPVGLVDITFDDVIVDDDDV